MNDIFSKRLKSARIQAALSQDRLVERMGGIVSKNAISKYEKGEMMADMKVLLALSKALNVKTDYFFRPFTVEIEEVEFRKRSKLSIKKLNAIKQQVTDAVEKYIEIEQLLNIKSDFVNPIAHNTIVSYQDTEFAANKVREVWDLGLNALSNVMDLLEDREIKVIEIDAPDEFDGFAGWADHSIPIIVINKNYNVERKRLTALHELGHLLLSFKNELTYKEKEKYCFRFAGAMLMPEKTFKKERKNNL